MKIRSYYNENYEFIIKHTLKNAQNNLHIKDEYTIKIQPEDFKRFINNKSIDFLKSNKQIKEILGTTINMDKISNLGVLITERSLCELSPGLPPLNIDVNKYLKKKDYEVEWEGEDIYSHKDILLKIFKELNISFVENTCSKRKRFLRELRTIR